MMNGVTPNAERRSLGNYDVEIQTHIIGENGALHPMARVKRDRVKRDRVKKARVSNAE